MIKRIIFGLLLLLLSTKSLNADTFTGFFLIIEKEIIEWKTISKTIPVRGSITYLDYSPTLLNQVGTKYLGTFAQIEWKGKAKEFELERIPVLPCEVLERQISEFPNSITMDN